MASQGKVPLLLPYLPRGGVARRLNNKNKKRPLLGGCPEREQVGCGMGARNMCECAIGSVLLNRKKCALRARTVMLHTLKP